jgi:hypothetical protein
MRAAHRESLVRAMFDPSSRRDVEHADPEPPAMGFFEIGKARSDIVGIRLRERLCECESWSSEKGADQNSAT